MILLLLALLLASCPVNAENLFKAESFTLNNGMKAIAIENHRLFVPLNRPGPFSAGSTPQYNRGADNRRQHYSPKADRRSRR